MAGFLSGFVDGVFKGIDWKDARKDKARRQKLEDAEEARAQGDYDMRKERHELTVADLARERREREEYEAAASTDYDRAGANREADRQAGTSDPAAANEARNAEVQAAAESSAPAAAAARKPAARSAPLSFGRQGATSTGPAVMVEAPPQVGLGAGGGGPAHNLSVVEVAANMAREREGRAPPPARLAPPARPDAPPPIAPPDARARAVPDSVYPALDAMGREPRRIIPAVANDARDAAGRGMRGETAPPLAAPAAPDAIPVEPQRPDMPGRERPAVEYLFTPPPAPVPAAPEAAPRTPAPAPAQPVRPDKAGRARPALDYLFESEPAPQAAPAPQQLPEPAAPDRTPEVAPGGPKRPDMPGRERPQIDFLDPRNEETTPPDAPADLPPPAWQGDGARDGVPFLIPGEGDKLVATRPPRDPVEVSQLRALAMNGKLGTSDASRARQSLIDDAALANQERPQPAPRTAPAERAAAAQAAKESGIPAGTEKTAAGTPIVSLEVARDAAKGREKSVVGRDMPVKATPAQRQRAEDGLYERVQQLKDSKVMEYYLRRGQFDKAKAYHDWMREGQTEAGVRAWARAVHAHTIGDMEGTLLYLTEAANTPGYYDNGYSIDPNRSAVLYDDAGKPSGLRIAYQRDGSDDVTVQEFSDIGAIYDMALTNLSPEATFEAGAAAVEAKRKADADAIEAAKKLEADARAAAAKENSPPEILKRRLEALKVLSADMDVPAEVRQRLAALILESVGAGDDASLPTSPPAGGASGVAATLPFAY